ncbi:hypothetical protein [Variovorax guangxiensis]|nr:hypothetical protein [Variovorax guangxiensis]RZI67593.1 MAG: hypothetical protein EOP79_05960 [Variovorax sp.]
MPANRIRFAFFGTALMLSISGFAQQPVERNEAQARYDAQVAACNRGDLANPAREACVRAAGAALDRTRGSPPVEAPVPSADGRATVVTPMGSTTPPAASDTITSGDGRATIVVPADRVPR